MQKAPVSDNLIKKRIASITTQNGYPDTVANTIVSLFSYMRKKQMYGCCHAFSSILYVAFAEMGLAVDLCIGECQSPNEKPYDHSWIVVDGKIVDLAIYMPLTQKINSITGPIIFNTDAITMKQCLTEYGIHTQLPLDAATLNVYSMPFDEYMSSFPYEKNGLWTVLQMVTPNAVSLDIANLKEKYATTKRKLVG